MKHLLPLLLIAFTLISCSTTTEQSYCSEGVMWQDSLRIYYSELKEIESMSFDIDGKPGQHYMAHISGCATGFCIDSLKEVEINAYSKWFRVIDGCGY